MTRLFLLAWATALLAPLVSATWNSFWVHTGLEVPENSLMERQVYIFTGTNNMVGKPTLDDCYRITSRAQLYLPSIDIFAPEKRGVNCTGSWQWGDEFDPNGIERVEMNTNWGHFTWYDIGSYGRTTIRGSLLDVEDRPVGSCWRVPRLPKPMECYHWQDKTQYLVEPVLFCTGNSAGAFDL
ncbi:hypothetical protein QBC34DRAFT_424697 [Podospora aff. communis PSN243]|uniref:Uncharacterized protein n=1 Tax=Podospora aff. communis PSN243 TaxID=3040156 RepID=A0AAV9GSX0_9PEZI|nr:hypothetical protein QBC34DRAFT_424697 [Podospora aff. communis PSN243]